MIRESKFLIRDRHAGFSIVELLVILAVLMASGLAVWTFQRDVFSLGGVFSSSLAGAQEARDMLRRFTAEARAASPSSTGAYPVAEATATSFTFYSDIDSDGLKERVRYFLSGSTIQRGVLKPTGAPPSYNPANEVVTIVIKNVQNGATPVFRYYDASYDGTTAPLASPVAVLSVRLIRFTVLTDQVPTRPPDPITVETQVSIRNVKDNL